MIIIYLMIVSFVVCNIVLFFVNFNSFAYRNKDGYGYGLVLRLVSNLFLSFTLNLGVVAILAYILRLGVDTDLTIFCTGIFVIVLVAYMIICSPCYMSFKECELRFNDIYNPLEQGFNMFYKHKLVYVNYRIDSAGKFLFMDNLHKADCIKFADGSTMGLIKRRRIVNFIIAFMRASNLLSDENAMIGIN